MMDKNRSISSTSRYVSDSSLGVGTLYTLSISELARTDFRTKSVRKPLPEPIAHQTLDLKGILVGGTRFEIVTPAV